MCNLNLLCKVNDGTCQCKDPACQSLCTPLAVPMQSPKDSALILSLFSIINQQNEVIKKISEDAKKAAQKLAEITEKFGLKSNKIQEATDQVTDASQLMKIISPETHGHAFFLQIISDIPQPAYKERAFSILLQIVNKNGEKAVLPNTTVFSVMFFTTESPPKLLKVNTSGDKVLRGTVNAEGDSLILFRKIVVKEVTSHFRNGCLFLVIAANGCPEVQPLIVPNFIIKARRLNDDGATKKKPKIAEEETLENQI